MVNPCIEGAHMRLGEECAATRKCQLISESEFRSSQIDMSVGPLSFYFEEKASYVVYFREVIQTNVL